MATAKKTAAKKTAAKPQAQSQVEDHEEQSESGSNPLEQVAREVMAGKWNSGRERDILLTGAGHDPRAVQREVARLRSQT